MSEKDVFCAVSTLGAGAGTVESVLGAVFYFLLKEDKQFLGRLSRSLMRRFSGSGFVCGYVVRLRDSSSPKSPWLMCVRSKRLSASGPGCHGIYPAYSLKKG